MGRFNLPGGQNNLLGGQMPTQLTCYLTPWDELHLLRTWALDDLSCKESLQLRSSRALLKNNQILQIYLAYIGEEPFTQL